MTTPMVVLGLFGIDDPAEYYRLLRERHDGMLDCRDLLRANAEKGGARKPHCDGMVFEAVRAVEEILAAKGL